jgi:hypothetical protein
VWDRGDDVPHDLAAEEFDAVVEVSRSCYRADRYTLRVQLGVEG